MFSAISSFSPKNILKNVYSTLVAGLDLDTKLVAPKPASQAAFDKAFWAGHYNAVIEELAEDFSQKSNTVQSLEILKERLLECQSMIGRRTLSPKFYEEGIQDLIEIFQENALEDEYLIAIEILDQIRSDFQEAVKEQVDFIKECFMGDVEHLVCQWIEGKVLTSYFRETIAYYADVMAPAHYYQGLLSLKSYLEADMRLISLVKPINQLLSEVDLHEVAQSRKALRKEVEEEILRPKTVVPDAAPHTVIRSDVGQPSSFADRLWAAGSGVVTYIITHPLQAITTGLAVQNVVVMAFESVLNLSNLNGENGFKIPGEFRGDALGFPVSSGDINGDNFDDILLGACHAGEDEGAAYVVFGSSEEWNKQFDLSSLNGVNGFKILGEPLVTRGFGVHLNIVGDLNADQISDFAVSSIGKDGGMSITYVVFGHQGSWENPLDLSRLNGVNGFRLVGETSDSCEVGRASDINGDGISDLVLGGGSQGVIPGVAYVIFGRQTGWPTSFNLGALNGENGFKLAGVVGNPILNAVLSINAEADINHDGYSDIIVGAKQAGGSYRGAAYVVFGARPWVSPFNLSSLNGTNGFEIIGENQQDLLGNSVSTAGDWNGDGIDDFIVGAIGYPAGQNNGATYILFGHSGFWPTPIRLSSLDHSQGFKIFSEFSQGQIGCALGAGGDLNGDGLPDLAIGAPAIIEFGKIGSTYVVFNQASAWGSSFNLSTLDGINGFRLEGEAASDASGISVALIKDFNGDGIGDLVIGALLWAEGRGSAYVVFGSPTISKISSVSMTNSRSITSTFSRTISPSGSMTITLTKTGTRSKSPSNSVSRSGSSSFSKSPTTSSSETFSSSVSSSLTKTGTRSKSSSNSVSRSGSGSFSKSPTTSSSETFLNSVSSNGSFSKSLPVSVAPSSSSISRITFSTISPFSSSSARTSEPETTLAWIASGATSGFFLLTGIAGGVWCYRRRYRQNQLVHVVPSETVHRSIAHPAKQVGRGTAIYVDPLDLKADKPPLLQENRTPSTTMIADHLNSWRCRPDYIPKPYHLTDVSMTRNNPELQKVVEAYQRSPVLGYDLKRIQVVYNAAFEQQFGLGLANFQQKSGIPVFAPGWLHENAIEQRQRISDSLDSMAALYRDPAYPHVKILALWHGTQSEALDSIFRTGFASLAQTDEGFYGKGIYFAYEAAYSYGVYSRKGIEEGVSHNGALLLNFVSCYSAYPVVDGDIEKLRGKHNYQNYDAHFIPVKPANLTNEREVNYLPCRPQDTAKYHELVVFQKSQCLPRYLVELQPSYPRFVKDPVIAKTDGLVAFNRHKQKNSASAISRRATLCEYEEEQYRTVGL
jgi:Poly(ADP-ribose) polymerase catalytic domain/FG-GAP repeat